MSTSTPQPDQRLVNGNLNTPDPQRQPRQGARVAPCNMVASADHPPTHTLSLAELRAVERYLRAFWVASRWF